MNKKLIEVSLPLDSINSASAREKSIRHGHPSTLHLWWARRPLAAARAVIFSQMVDDPSEYADELLADAWKAAAARRELKLREEVVSTSGSAGVAASLRLKDIAVELERERLFEIIRKLVKWENTTNEEVLESARSEIQRSWRRTCAQNTDHPRATELFDPEKLPAFHDPFAGGGALPLEAQRLGLEAYASDLNPVAVLINKAMIEIPPRFAGKPPVNPEAREGKELLDRHWQGAQGLAEDVRYYGKWMRDEAEKRIGHLYPKVEVTPDMVRERPDLKPYQDQKLTVIAWLWARTVRSPNPAFADVEVPLTSTWMLSTKKGKEAYVEPVIEGRGYRFEVRVGMPKDVETAKKGTSAGKRNAFRCLLSGIPIPYAYIRVEGKAKRMESRLMAIVAEGNRGRVYLSPYTKQSEIALQANPMWKPDCEMPKKHRNFQGPVYGLNNLGDLFTHRQLLVLTTFSKLIKEVAKLVLCNAATTGLPDDGVPLRNGGKGVTAYTEAVSMYLGFIVDKCSDYWSSISGWSSSRETLRNTFGRQAIPMVWDFAEGNPFSSSTGNWTAMISWICKSLGTLPITDFKGSGMHADASSQSISVSKVVSTDPPYYDNIGYADLSDFFYVWLRRSIRFIFPDLFSTLAVPKAEELVATPYRHGSKQAAESFFLDGMRRAMNRLAKQAHPGFPVTIYYAFKQSERKGNAGVVSTGWETFLEAVIHAGFGISGTLPMRTELGNRMVGMGTNALASSIVLVCRRRPHDAPLASRREFVTELKAKLPPAIADLQRGNIAPVDLAQAAIGPGMAVYTRYASSQIH